MARIRTIKPEFFTSLTIASLHIEARLTFIGLWTHCDDSGRCVDDTRLIRAGIWPLDDRSFADVEKDLDALANHSLIRRYQVSGRRYLEIITWGEHQKISHPTASKFPPYVEGREHALTCENGDSGEIPEISGDAPETLRPERNGKEQGKERKSGIADAPPRPDVDQICTRLADKIEANGSLRPAIGPSWHDAARLMIDKDARPVAEIVRIIDWCQAHHFWKSNILSIPKLREKYDQLRLQSQQRASGQRNGHQPYQNSTDPNGYDQDWRTSGNGN